MRSDFEKTLMTEFEQAVKEHHTIKELSEIKDGTFIIHTGSPCEEKINWSFGYNFKTGKCDLDDGTGHIKRGSKDYKRTTFDSDFGPGVYLTGDEIMASAWACTQMKDLKEGIDKPGTSRNGALHTYKFNFKGLKILDLSSDKSYAMEYLAVILYNRSFPCEESKRVRDRIDFIIKNYLPEDIDTYDVICGPRADALYGQNVEMFLLGEISLETFVDNLPLGNLGEQIALVSKEAMERLEYYREPVVLSDKKEFFFSLQNTLSKDGINRFLESVADADYGTEINDICNGKIKNIKDIHVIKPASQYKVIDEKIESKIR